MAWVSNKNPAAAQRWVHFMPKASVRDAHLESTQHIHRDEEAEEAGAVSI